MKYQYINLDKLNAQERLLLSLLDIEPSVSFTFWKKSKDGPRDERREANGTRNLEYIPEERWPKNPTEDVSKKINYYDFAREDWRSVSNGKLISINRIQ